MKSKWKRIVFGGMVVILFHSQSSSGSNQVVNGGFEVVESTTDPLPTTFGDWAGDLTAIVTSEAGIIPAQGTRMLHFVNTDRRGPRADGVWSEVFQLIDLAGFSGEISSGTAKAVVSFRVNRIPGDAETDTQFGIWMAAYEGSPMSFPSQINHSDLVIKIVRHFSDSDVDTWELVSGELDLPENTDFLAINIYAGENIHNDAVNPEFDGHYGDEVVVEIVTQVDALSAHLDIKPGSCPNPLNTKPFHNPPKNAKPKKGGVLPVAVLGTGDFDVSDIDPSTLFLVGTPPLRYEYEDVAAPVVDGEECECIETEPDGYMDLTLKFSKMDIVEALGAVSDDDVIPLTITGQLYDGTEIRGTDCVWIRHDILEPPLRPLAAANETLTLGPAVPNPFNPATRIGFRVDTDGPVSLRIYDIAGSLIKTLVDGDYPAGSYTEEWDGRDELGNHVASGVYLCRLTAGKNTLTRKAVLIR